METPTDPTASSTPSAESPADSSSSGASQRPPRTRYSADYKRQVLDAFEASDLSAPAFARQCGLKYPTLAGWIARRRRGGPSATPAQGENPFVLAEILDPADGHALEVRLPGGAVARASGTSQLRLLAELLRHLH